MEYSIYPLDGEKLDHAPRVVIGGDDCKQPYSASIFNISAMSYGSLSKNAVLALNGGAKTGGFAHNTGEGGILPADKNTPEVAEIRPVLIQNPKHLCDSFFSLFALKRG